MPLADYFRVNIFEKHGLTSTLYDPTNGALGIHKKQLPYPAYITYLQPGQDAALADTAGATIQQLTASAGNPGYWGGDFPGNTSNGTAGKQEADMLAGGAVSVGMTAKYPGPSGFDWTLANAAGAIVSTPQDMAKWFRALLVEADHLGLGKELLREFLTLSTDVPGMPWLNVSSNGSVLNTTLVFAQGLVVLKDSGHARGLGVSNVYYLGSLGGFQASVYMWLDPRDPAKDVFVNAVAATVLPDRGNWPAAAQNLTNMQCLEGHSAIIETVAASNSSSADTRSAASSASSSRAAVGGRHRRLMTTSFLEVTIGKVAGASPHGVGIDNLAPLSVLCELSSMVPSAIKTVPDMLARKVFRGVTGREWFNMH
jgi:hypothetical protein